MGITEVLTIVFVTLKLCGVITWSWWWILSPEIIAAVFYTIVIVGLIKFHAHMTPKR